MTIEKTSGKSTTAGRPVSVAADRLPLPAPGLDSDSLAGDFQRYFHHTLGRDHYQSAPQYQLIALALTLRDRLIAAGNQTRHAYEQQDSRRVCYLSLEYLLGRSLRNAALNLGADAALTQALDSLGLCLEDIAELEHDAGLGNGGLGRLAACLLDSCATLSLPVIGYGLRYQYGIFSQRIHNGYRSVFDIVSTSVYRSESKARVSIAFWIIYYPSSSHSAWRLYNDLSAISNSACDCSH